MDNRKLALANELANTIKTHTKQLEMINSLLKAINNPIDDDKGVSLLVLNGNTMETLSVDSHREGSCFVRSEILIKVFLEQTFAKVQSDLQLVEEQFKKL